MNIHHEKTESIKHAIQHHLETLPSYEAKKQITKDYLGLHQRDDGLIHLGFWIPGVQNGFLSQHKASLRLEVWRTKAPYNPQGLNVATLDFEILTCPVAVIDEYAVAVLEDLHLGTATSLGDLYWLTFKHNSKAIIRDPLAGHLPFGIYAPAEAYDFKTLLENRQDMTYFKTHHKGQLSSGHYLAKDIGMCLEIHTETATEEGTLAALTTRLEAIKKALEKNPKAPETLPTSWQNFIGFDTIELMPEVPTSEREVTLGQSEFFVIKSQTPSEAIVTLKRPNISNWGYDTPVLGSVATSPSLLETLRPDEMLRFIETLHTMPGTPMQLCIDSVLGHCDFQGALVLETFEQPPHPSRDPKYIHSAYLTGPNMYGRDIDFAHENVRAMLLELLRRKINLGYDAIRIDGAQDFIAARDEVTGFRIQNDAFLKELVSIEQDINGVKRYLDINLEDGRPWPDDLNWLYNSTYLDHSFNMTLEENRIPKQWSPIIFAHNVHGKFKWFMDKWDRFVEVYRYGEHWITGQSNHDNARYFYKMVPSKSSLLYEANQPFSDYYNAELGETKKDVVHRAMDHPALSALMTTFLPGHPMFLLNALTHTPWMFLRDIDHTYAAMILADEGAKFFEWYVDEATYARHDNFKALKALGFKHYSDLMGTSDTPKMLNHLKRLASLVKTDALSVRTLFEDPSDEGLYATLSDLKDRLKALQADAHGHLATLNHVIQSDPDAHQGRLFGARHLLQKNLKTTKQKTLRLQQGLATLSVKESFVIQTQLDRLNAEKDKITWLLSLPDDALGWLLMDAHLTSGYDVEAWASDDALIESLPQAYNEAHPWDKDALMAFAKVFFKDALDACKVPKYESTLDPAHVAFNLKCRTFRHVHPWLKHNPSNHIREDYFARKLYTNGAKDTGDWGDKGDVVNCNTLYYGWRTNPEKTKQIFFLANMEGSPIERLPLRFFLPGDHIWQVALHSPSVILPSDTLVNVDQLTQLENGAVIVLSRDIDDSQSR